MPLSWRCLPMSERCAHREGTDRVPPATRVDLHFRNDVGDRWVLEHATPAELREVADEMAARETEKP